MGVVQRQGFKQTLITYLGIALGGLAAIFLFPRHLVAYGTLEWLLNTALVLVPFVLLGTTGVATRFFPEFKNESGTNRGFLGLLLLTVTTSILLFAGLVTLFYDPFTNLIVEVVSRNSQRVDERFLPLLVLFVAAYCFQQLLVQYASNGLRIVVPRFFDYLLPKLGKPLLFLAFLLGTLSLGGLIWGMLALILLAVLGLAVYLHRIGLWHLRIDWAHLTPDRRRRLATFAGYGTLGGTGHIIANRIDIVMVGALTGDMKIAGVYTIVTYLSEFIDAPRKALFGITAPLVAAAWQRNDRAEVADLYWKSSLNLLIIGLGLLAGVWLSIDALFRIMPDTQSMEAGRWVVLMLGVAKVVDMATGINSFVIGYSKWFRFNFLAVLVLAGLNVVNNLVFIPRFGINGAALATLSSVVLYNLIKFAFAWRKLKMQPFGWGTVRVLLVGGGLYALFAQIPLTGNVFWDIPARSGGFALAFAAAVYYGRLSEDLRGWVDGLVKKLGGVQ